LTDVANNQSSLS